MHAHDDRQAAYCSCAKSARTLRLAAAHERTEGIDGAVLQQEDRVLASVCWVAGIHTCLRDQLLLPSPGLPCTMANVVIIAQTPTGCRLVLCWRWTL